MGRAGFESKTGAVLSGKAKLQSRTSTGTANQHRSRRIFKKHDVTIDITSKGCYSIPTRCNYNGYNNEFRGG
jgi:hypothetical protein